MFYFEFRIKELKFKTHLIDFERLHIPKKIVQVFCLDMYALVGILHGNLERQIVMICI